MTKRKRNLNFIYSLAFPVLAAAIILAVWGIAAYSVDEELIVPSIKTTLAEFISLFGSAEFYAAYGRTLLRTLISFFISYILAFVFALLSYKFQPFKKFIKPFIGVIRALPTVSVILWLVLWTKSGTAAMTVTCLVTFPMLYGELSAAFNEIDPDLTQMLKIYGVSEKKSLIKFYIPVLLPSGLNSVGSGLSLNLKLMVSAEVLASARVAIGGMLSEARNFYMSARLMALTLVTVFSALILEWIFALLAKSASKWKK